jgi:hypothetical protein
MVHSGMKNKMDYVQIAHRSKVRAKKQKQKTEEKKRTSKKQKAHRLFFSMSINIQYHNAIKSDSSS